MNPFVKAYFKRVGAKGGRARADNLTPERLTEIARHAANTRWSKARKKVLDKPSR
jgi:hypothetical protein